MNINESYTHRGFKIIEFKDLYDTKCNIQESSLATDEAIWIGVEDANPQIMNSNNSGWSDYPIPKEVFLTTRMHLTRKQVEKILPILEKFVSTGDIY